MKTNKLVLATLVTGIFLMSSCIKPKSTSTADPNAKQHNEDVSNTKSESDNVNTDINNVLKDVPGFGKTDETQAFNICGATVNVDSQYSAVPTITITFDDATFCGNPARKRGGSVKVQLISGAKWSDPGAKLKITHTNYKVTYQNLNNHYLIFNGTKYLTDVNGFNWINVWLGTSTVTIKERSDDMTVTFENGDTESWNTARLSTWGISAGQIYAIVNGDSIASGKIIDSWGTTRFGTHFTTEMISPWKSGTKCGWWKPTEGKYTSRTDNFTVTATFGVDRNGNATSTECGAYGLKLEWDYQSGTATGNTVIAYF